LLAAMAVTGLLYQACTDNPAVRLRYDLEKEYYAVEKNSRDAAIRPQLNAPGTAAAIRKAYGELVERCYHALDSIDPAQYPTEFREIEELTFKSSTRLSQHFFALRHFDTCQAIITRLLERVRIPGVEGITARYNLGRAMQAGGQWDSAMAVYDSTLELFYPPLDRDGSIVLTLFNLPLHLYRITIQAGNESESSRRLDVAENYYQRLISDYADAPLGAASHAGLGRLYELAGRYRPAIEQFGLVRDSLGNINAQIRLHIADLYATGLDMPDTALAHYRRIEADILSADTLLQPVVMLKQALVHQHKGDYQAARNILVDLESRYRFFYRTTPQAQLTKAQSFEREDNWARAESEYRFLIENYAGSEQAMSAYLFLARHFAGEGRPRESDIWYQRAEQYFEDVIRQSPSTLREATARTYKAELLRQKGDLAGAAGILTSIFERFPNSAIGQRALLTAARVYADELDNRAAADSLVQLLRNSLTEVDETTEF